MLASHTRWSALAYNICSVLRTLAIGFRSSFLHASKRVPNTKASARCYTPSPARNGARFPWTQEERDIFLRMTGEGAKAKEIASVLNRTVSGVYAFKQAPRSTLSPAHNAPKRSHPWSAEEKEALAQMWQRGDSYASIAASLGRSFASIDTALKIYGIRPRSKLNSKAHSERSSRKPFTLEEYNSALKLRAEGFTFASIAGTLGRSQPSVARRLSKAQTGVKFRGDWKVSDAERKLVEQLRLQGKTYREIQTVLPHRGYTTIWRVAKHLNVGTAGIHDDQSPT